MGKALYRVYRPKKLTEVVGQEHITQTLSNALKQGRINHAYLLTGPRGTGKTSVARILAHAINDLPYTDDSPHMDIIEIDAASNRRIDEIRELRERVYVAPTSAKYKVYIIDEVHMLTREAFNALLKTLEEPPEHVVFILATTDAHKLPPTIISRTQRFSFKPVAEAQVTERLQQIAKQEKLSAEPLALKLLAEHGEGSFRDSISLMDQAASQGKITTETVGHLLGLPSDSSIRQLLELMTDAQPGQLIQALGALYDQGYQAVAIAKRLAGYLRQNIMDGQAVDQDSLALLSGLIEVPAAYDPERALEVLLLRYHAQPASVAEPVQASQPQSQPEPPPAAKPAESVPKAEQKPLDASSWPEILRVLKQRHNTLCGVVRMAEPDFSEPGMLRLAFAFAFHQKRLNENANREKLADIIQELTGQAVRIEGLLNSQAKPPEVEPAPPSDENLTVISNIFGGAELVES